MQTNKPIPKTDPDNRSQQLDATNPTLWRERGKSPVESEQLATDAALAAKKAADTKVVK